MSLWAAKDNARHFTMKGRAFEKASDLSGGKVEGLRE